EKTDRTFTYIYSEPGSYEPLAQCYKEDDNAEHTVNYFHCDQIGIPREMTDSDGKLIWKGRYDAWGSLIRDSYRETASDSHQPFRLQNQYFDEETGLHYNFFRYYEPVLGRFITQDPIGVRGGSNLYFFAPSAQMWSDSLGLSAVQVAKGVLSFIATDTAIVEPTDVAWPKWVAYGILAALAVGVIALSESETCIGKCEEQKPKRCKEPTFDNIKEVTRNTPYYTLQKSVSIPAVARYTALIESGSPAPAVKMDGNTIVDGNHRMVAGLLCNKVPLAIPWTAPVSIPRIPLRDIMPDYTDWGNY
ncbi:RHS repeat domain-containing protein, partial [Aggregatibacter aphrophilus]